MAQSSDESNWGGGCSCGLVRYQTNQQPEYQLICQCHQCQKLTGSGHAPLIAVKADSFKLNGKLKYFETIADDGNSVSHGFCPNCGNPILNKPVAYPDMVYLLVGSLDQPADFKPEFVVFSDRGHNWDTLNPELKKY